MGKTQRIELGSTSKGSTNYGIIHSYKKPYSRAKQLDVMADHHHVKITKKSDAEIILQKVPYNLLIYPALKIWYAKSANGNMFMRGTKIEYLYELYKFDSFIKGKILEMLRAFENMFLGALSYHFELEYNCTYNKMGSWLARKTKRHNVGYQKEEIKKGESNYNIVPMWNEFFSTQSNIDMNGEKQFWDALEKSSFLKMNSQLKDIYLDKIHAKRFSKNEIKFIKNNFRPSRVRNQCITDIIRFSSVTQKKWKADIANSNFCFFLDVIREFRNSASHPGYILNKITKLPNNKQPRRDKKYNGKNINLKIFIEIMPYFIPRDIIDDFTMSIKEKLLLLNNKQHIPLDHIRRIEQKLGIYILDD
ncbi:Abi family protein [Lentilactobacillus kefiri]|uniref:Abi family protein n=5 Tax=Bacilli TaxID=91061 RepID=UPI000BA5D850|nr:Abi family protein [Lentilactobacillus kefiri]PAK80688.1 hypothetical protein B8W85_11430 [Lentilactobacillus kefiri]